MSAKKKLLLLLGLVVMAVGFASLNRQTSGRRLLSWIQQENITQVTVQKTIENGAHQDLGAVTLTASEAEQFYAVLSEAQLRESGAQTFTVSSDVRYCVSFLDAAGISKGTLRFYGDEFLLFDLASNHHAPIHKRYSIRVSDCSAFFDTLF